MAQMVRNDQEYERQIEAAYRDLHNLLSQNKQLAPTLLRLAFHDAGTYDAKTNTGGPNGSVRNELNTPPNVKMDIAINFCEPVKQRHPMITYADLYQLAGVVAVEVTGGPKIRFVPGRKDAPPQQDQGSLPNPSPSGSVVGHLRTIFQRMGLSDKDIVVLSGAHTLGRAHQDRSGFDGPFTRDPLTFDNSYYVELMKGDSQGLVKFPTDKALMQDPVFRRYVQVYAQDEMKFFKHYAKSHKKMSELGFHPNQTSTHTTTTASNTNVLGLNLTLGNPVDLLNALDERKFFKHYAKSHKKMSELGFHPNQHGSRQHQPPQSHPNPHHNRHNDHAAPHQQSQTHQHPQCRPHRPCPFA